VDIQKVIIYAGLVVVGLMLWSEWQREHSMVQDHKISRPERADNDSPVVNGSSSKSKIERAPSHFSKNIKTLQSANSISDNTITVKTDLLKVEIDRIGGGIVDATLLKHYINSNGEINYKLFDSDPKNLYLAETGIIVNGKPLPRTEYMSEKIMYSMSNNDEKLIVKLKGLQTDNIAIEKTYVFTRGKHSIKVDTKVNNNGAEQWNGRMYYQLIRKEKDASGSFMPGMSQYIGAAISDSNNKIYEKISFSDMRKKILNREVTSGWVAMQEHYFLTAIIPPEKSVNTFYSQAYSDNQFGIGYSTPIISVNPGDEEVFSANLYVGPEYSDELKELSPGLELTIDYGWLWFISGFLFTALKTVNKFVNNWGWSIIIVTILIKLLFYKLSAAGYRSMANMKKFQPKMQALKDRYKDDKQKLNQAMMDIYKKEKINPLGGCLPIVIQIPVFIALYWVLLESVELRHSPFILWVGDLSSKDPYYILPILMGATMFLQQKLSPPPSDPAQAKVMGFLPVIFTFLFLSVPSGLVLYWTVNNLLSILQQWHITKQIEGSSKPQKALTNA
jgi:YidC/Oxa1 family membrane protein insertase